MALSESTLAQIRKIAGLTESTTPKSSVHNKKEKIVSKDAAKPEGGKGSVPATSPKSSVHNKKEAVKSKDAKPVGGSKGVPATTPKSSVKPKAAQVKENEDADVATAEKTKPAAKPALSKEEIDEIRSTVRAHGDSASAKKAVGEMHKDAAKREHAHKLVDRFARESAEVENLLKVAGVDDPLKNIPSDSDVIVVTEGEKIKCIFGGPDCFAAARKFLAVARGAVGKGKPFKYEGHKFTTTSSHSSK